MAGTVNGIILGTAAYLSPEQARGRTLDKRADVWAFGCVLDQMLAGRAAFARETISDTISAILTQEPDWSALPADLPPAVTRLLHRCLAKDARHRLHDIADARLDLDEMLSSPATVGRAATAPFDGESHPKRGLWPQRLPWMLLALTALALGAVSAAAMRFYTPVTLGALPEIGKAQPLFETNIESVTGFTWHQYDVSQDGQRFLVNTPEAVKPPVTVVLGWPALVGR